MPFNKIVPTADPSKKYAVVQPGHHEEHKRRPRKSWGHLWSIRCLNVNLFVAVVLATGISIWITVFASAQPTIAALGDRSRKELMGRLHDFIADFVATTPTATRILKERFIYDRTPFPDHLSNPNNALAQRQMYLAMMQNYPHTGFTFYGDEATGRVIGVDRDPEDNNLVLATLVVNNTLYYYHMDKYANLVDVAFHSGEYDARVRTWYVTGKTKGTAWSEPFFSLSVPPRLSISFVTPILNNTDGSFMGCLTVSNFLDSIADYLTQFSISSGARLFLLGRDGYMIGANVGGVEGTDAKGALIRVRGDAHRDSVIRDTSAFLAKHYGSFGSIKPDGNSLFYTDTTGTQKIVETVAITDEYGLDWVAVYVTGYNELYGTLVAGNVISAVVGGVIVVLSMGIAILFAVCITKPLHDLTNHLELIAHMEFDQNAKPLNSSLYEYKTMESGLIQLYRGLNNFEKFLPGDVVREIVQKNAQVELGVSKRELTVMFCDLMNFTNMTEKTDLKVLIDVMQGFFSVSSAAVATTGGTVDKYIGDCVMAFWNAPNRVDDHQLRAIEAALDIQAGLTELNKEYSARGFPTLAARIGINTSEVLVGLVGAPSRMNYTTLGDGVNIASRLESLNNLFQTKIMISEFTYESAHCDQFFGCRFLDYVYLKGKDSAVGIYEVIGRNSDLTEEQQQDILMYDKIQLELKSGNIELVKQLTKKVVDDAAKNNQSQFHYPAKCLYDRLQSWKPGQDQFLRLHDK